MTPLTWLETHAPNASPAQRPAILTSAPTVVVVAGPGSGKTSTVVNRIKCLLATGTNPARIVAITFTNKAADEVQKRLGDVRLNYIGTLHGYCLRIIQAHGNLLGYGDNVAILDDDDVTSILEEIRVQMKLSTPVKRLQEIRAKHGIKERPRTKEEIALSSYRQRLRQESAVDFETLLTEALLLLKLPAVAASLDIEHLFVDEFQDSGTLDYQLYQALPAANRFYVGDPDQAIYSFRGGRLENILELCQSPGTTVIPLEGNYRSGRSICAAAQTLINNNQARYAKQTVAVRDAEGCINVLSCATENDELWNIFQFCNAMLGVAPAEEIAVLARHNSTVNAITAELKAGGIPVREKARVSDDNKLLRAAIECTRNPHSDIAAANWIRLKFGPEELAAAQRDSRLMQVPMCKAPKVPGIPKDSWGGTLLTFLARLGFTKADLDPVTRIMSWLPEPDLGRLSLALQAPEPEDSGTGVTVTTMHGAKGLEFEHVWVAAADQEVIPGRSDVEEERRLFYVAITRAKNELVISTRKCRKVQFNPKLPATIEPCTPSQFIEEMRPL